MECKSFEFKIDLLSGAIIDREFCNRFDLNYLDSGGFGLGEKVEIGKSYDMLFSGNNKSVSTHFIVLPDKDGKYEVKVRSADVTQRRQRHR